MGAGDMRPVSPAQRSEWPAVSDPAPVPTRRANGITAVAGDVVDALRTSPIILLIVLLNMAFAGGATYYLANQEEQRAQNVASLVALLEKCTMHTVPIEALQYMRRTPE